MKKFNILWVEDEGKFRLYELIEPIIEDGNKVDIAVTAKEAKLFLKKDKYDLILMDLIIPKGDESSDYSPFVGLQLLEDLMNNYGYNSEQIIVLTVVSSAEILKEIRSKNVKIFNKGAYLPSKLKEDIYNFLESQ